MPNTNRRMFLGTLAFGAGLVADRSFADANDGHAAGYDVAPASNFLPLVPRKPGDPVVFTASLDKGPIKATSGGWAREITARNLPIATGIAGAHLFLNPGGAREMHWHNAAEWAYVLSGFCQITVVDPEGEVEVANCASGDLWFFPKGHSHAIHAIGSEPCHAILAFDDGLYSEHGTFGVSDWMSRCDPPMLQQAYGLPGEFLGKIPKAETYIMQGELVARDGPQARAAKELGRARTHRFALMAQAPREQSSGGALYVASAREFPMSSTMTGMALTLKPGALHEPHWHPDANEWHYVTKGRTRVTLFAADKHMAVAELTVGDCAYIPRGCGHSVQNIGTGESEIIGVFDSGEYSESLLSAWLAKAPRHLLANNYGVPEAGVAMPTNKRSPIIALT